MLLAHIGVTGEPIDPATPFEELETGETIAPEFLPGPMQPMTHRNMAIALISHFPPAELKCLAAVFQVAASEKYAVDNDSDNRHIQRSKAKVQLARMVSPTFDAFPRESLYFIDMRASARVLRESIGRLSRIWKRRLGLRERRVSLDKFDDALAVWDQREGWRNGTYSVDRCQPFPDIARDCARKQSTIINQYRSAYEWITGRPYSIDSWVLLFSRLFIERPNQKLSSVYLRRFQRLIQPVITRDDSSGGASAAEVAASTGQVGYLEIMDPIVGDAESVDFRIDFEDLPQQR